MNSPSSPPPPADPRRVRRWRLGVTAALLAAAAGLGVLAVTGVLGQRAQVRGHITVASCTFERHNVHSDTYSCLGSFAGDATGVRTPVVSFHTNGTLHRGEVVAATVSGPADGTASLVSDSWWRLAVTGGGALMLLAVVALLWRAAWRQRPAATGS